MRYLDWLLAAVALGSIAILLIFYGPICGPNPTCQELHFFPESFVAFALAVIATLAFAVRRVVRPGR